MSEEREIASLAEAVMDQCISEDPRKTQGIGGDNMTCVIVVLKQGH